MEDTVKDLEVLSSSSALDTIERAQFDVQISTAKRYPRSLKKVKSDMLSFATLDEETASACFYSLPRGGKTIQGPSVRLAEIAAACWTNLKVASRVVAVEAAGINPHVVTQSVAHDLENNTAVSIEKRRRITKKKNKPTLDEDDVNLAANACQAISFRDAVFKVVPQALIRPVMEEAKRVAIGDVKSLAERRIKIIDRLKQMGASQDRILAVVEAKGIDDVDLAKLEILIGLGTALKDGAINLEEAFPPVKPVIKAANVSAPAEKGSPKKSETSPEPAKLPEPDKSIQDQLADFALSRGANFDRFMAVAIEQGWVHDTAEYGHFDEIPDDVARKILASPKVTGAALEEAAK